MTEDSASPTVLHRWSRASMIYLIAVSAATWPYVLTFRSRLPSMVDPLQHLWVMNWYRTCLTEGRSPLVCDEIQYPMGAPLGNFSPLHLQGLLFVVLRFFIDNDVFVYNVLWLVGFLTTGLGTYALARRVVANEPAALLAGLLAMLSGPMMVHSHCHLELIFVGGFPLFLAAWIRFVDEPSARRLALSVGGFAIVSMSAAYFLVFATIAGAVYVFYRAFESYREGDRVWLVRRLPYFAAFGAICVAILLLLFAPHLWATRTGRSLGRTKEEFDSFHLPWWTYLVPCSGHRLARFLPFDPYVAARITGEGMGYLGVVSVLLVGLAAARGVNVERVRFWWILLGVLFVFSLGSYLPNDGHPIELPASWLWELYPPFRLIRVPGRFKFFVAVVAAVLAAAAYARLDRRLRTTMRRGTVFALASVIAVVDLAHEGYPAESVPAVPRGYVWLVDRDPDAVWVDVPQMSSGTADLPNAACMYWQSIHRGRTTAGYSGQSQRPLDNLLAWSSPFAHYRMSEPGFLSDPSREHFDLVTDADPASYLWTYLTIHRLPYVVLHRWTASTYPALARARELLEPAKIYEDDALAIYERDRLPRPTRPVLLCMNGWDARLLPPRDGLVRPVGSEADCVVFNPDANRTLVLGMKARAFGQSRRVVVRHEARVLAAWSFPREAQQLVVSSSFRLPAGFSRVSIATEGEVPFGGDEGHSLDYIARPISLFVSGMNLRAEPVAIGADLVDGTEVTR